MNYDTDKQLFLELIGMVNDLTYFCEHFVAGTALDDTMQATLVRRTTEARELHKRAQKFVRQQVAEYERVAVQHRKL